MTRELSVHRARLDEFAQVMLGRLVDNVNAKCLIELFWRSDATKAIDVLLGVVPLRFRDFWVHVNNTKQTFHRLLASSSIFVCMLPESLDLSSLGFIFAIGVMMEANASLCRIEIVSNRKAPDTDGHFLS